MADIAMRIVLSAVGGSAVTSSISSIAGALGPGGGLAGALIGIGAAAATAAVGIGVTAVKAAADFQSGLTTLSTGAGESQKNLKMVGDGILSLATSTGTSTKQLTDGMYMIESAGFHGKAGLDVLKNAAEGAKVGNADLGTVADATTTIMTDFANKNVTASQAVNTLIATVANGKTTMQALSGALSQIMPTASAAGISLTDTSAALATMTGEGVPAANAATYLRQTIIGLQAPSKQTVTALAGIGLSSKQVSDEMKVSLPGALQMITDHLKKKFPEGSAEYVNALKNISGGSKTMQGMLDLTGQHLQTFKNNVTNIAGAVKQGGSSITGWSQVQQNFNFKMAQGKEVIETLMIKIGQQLLPVVTKLLGQIIPMVSRFGDWLIKSGALQNGITTLVNVLKTMVSVGSNVVNFFSHNQAAMVTLKIVVIALAGAIGGIMVSALVAMAVAAWAAIVPLLPFIAIGALVALVIAGIVLAVMHWGQIAHWLQGVWAAVVAWIKGVFGGIGAFFSGVWHSIQSAFGGVGAFFTGIWHGVQQTFANVGNWFKDRFKQAQDGMKSGWNNVTGFLHGVGQNIGDTFHNAAVNTVKAHQWMMAHNYYYHDAVVAIQNWTNQAKSFITNAWNNVKNTIANIWNGIKTAFNTAISFLKGVVTNFWNTEVTGWTNIWNRIKSIVTSLWNDVRAAFNAAFSFISGIVTNIWDTEVRGWNNIWNSVKGIVTNMWNSVTSAFNNAWGGISNALSGLWNNISGWFSNLASQALTWGSNVVHMIAQGITNAAGAVTDAVSGIANNIKQFLGFHSPAELGPASDADKWMPNFMGMMASGIVNGLPQFQRATNLAASTLAKSLDPSTLADQLSFTGAPTAIYSGTRNPVETRAVKQEEAEDKREARKAAAKERRQDAAEKRAERHQAALERRAAHHHASAHHASHHAAAHHHRGHHTSAAAAEKRLVRADIREIKAELHIHTSNTRLDHAQIQEIVDQATRQFGLQMGEQIRAQFGNI